MMPNAQRVALICHSANAALGLQVEEYRVVGPRPGLGVSASGLFSCREDRARIRDRQRKESRCVIAL